MDVSKQEWIDWKSNSVTKEYLRRILDKREQIKEGLVEGQSTREEVDKYIGQCQAYKDSFDYAVFDFEYEEVNSIEEQEDDSKGNRV